MSQRNFFADYVERVLRECGLGYLTSAQKEQYVPQITALLEERVGLELLPKLDKDHVKRFMAMTEDVRTTVQQWKKFWMDAIPDFEAEMRRILDAFAAAARQKLSS